MLDKHLLPLVVLLAAGALGSAQAAPPDNAAASPAPTVQPRSPNADNPPNCLTQTGSYVKAAKGECISAPGRSYTREDMERTGATNVGDTLNKLDPSLTVTH